MVPGAALPLRPLRKVFPPLAGQFINVVKDSSLAADVRGIYHCAAGTPERRWCTDSDEIAMRKDPLFVGAGEGHLRRRQGCGATRRALARNTRPGRARA